MNMRCEERKQAPVAPINPLRKGADEDGPSKPDVRRPDTGDLLKRMRQIDPDSARRYRQRSGE